MTPEEFTQRMNDIDNQEPSLHKLDKKMTIIIMQQVEALSTLGKHETRLDCIDADRSFIKGVGAAISAIFTIAMSLLALKK